MRFVQPIRDLELIEKIKRYLKDVSYRDYFMFVMGINTGLRISDMLKLRVVDVKNVSHIILIEEKTGKHKRFLINDNLKYEIEDYISYKHDNEYLFTSRQKRNRQKSPLTRFQAYNILRSAAENFGLKEIGTHTLRKTFGYHFYKKTKDVEKLRLIFNHSGHSVTLRYIGVEQDEIDKSLREFSL